MRAFSVFRVSGQTMKRKLFGYMLILALVLLMALVAGLFLFGKLNTDRQEITRMLELQLAVFEKEIAAHTDELAVRGIHLADELTDAVEEVLQARVLSFAGLKDQGKAIADLQERMLEPLYLNLRQTSCSGAFVMLNTTVNSGLDHADGSRSGLYLQINGSQPSGVDVLLYRGIAEIGKKNGMMPHRKWRLEFQTEQFPGCDGTQYAGVKSAEEAYAFTPVFTLPGTSEKAVLLTVPLLGKSGEVYGVCGFEVSQSYFKVKHAQPASFTHMLCAVGGWGEKVCADMSLSSGVLGGYYLAPQGEYRIESAEEGLLTFHSGTDAYVGLRRKVELDSSDKPMMLAVMIPKGDYDNAVIRNHLQIVALTLLLLFLTAGCCLYFSRRFLTPVLNGLEALKSPAEEADTSVAEINDLMEFLSAKDKVHEETLQKLEKQRSDLLNEVENAQEEITRLKEKRRQEIDSDAYEQFLLYLHTLTAKEREIFDLYKDGKTAREIQSRMNINENTLKYHNRNLYTKLGVSSRKQLLLFAALMKKEAKEDAAPPKEE